MTKKVLVFAATAVVAAGAYARPWGPCPGWRPGPCHPPPPRCHGDWWGRGGCNFWPGFVGGVIGGAVAQTVVRPAPVVVTQPTVVTTPVVTTPVVVTQPTVVTQPAVVTQPVVTTAPVTSVQNVWVEGRYIDQVQANGSVVRVWNPGHFEQRTVTVQ